MVVKSPVPKLPIIDLSKENFNSSSAWLSRCNDVRRALEEYGCFVAIFDEISPQLHKSIFNDLKQLFDLPTETKMRNVSDKPYFGYLGNGHPFIPPLQEGLGIEDATTLESARSFTNLMWPNEGNSQFCENVISYTHRVSKLEQTVKRMVFASYGIDKYYNSHLRSTSYLLRLTKYRAPETNESGIGCPSHTDKSFITILHQNEVNGLEIETMDGHWIGFEPSPPPSSFLVMAGDSFLAWSNGRIHSASHRVVMSGTKARYSVALFSNYKGTVEIPDELVDEQHPVRFKSFDPYGLIQYFHKDPKAESTAKAYCGVN